MKKYLAYAVVFLVLVALIYLQFRTWKNFDWARLVEYRLHWWRIAEGVAFIYFSYLLRAFRWKIFLRPVRPDMSVFGLLPPTLIGFAGLALLGRPGELSRPYLIARRLKLSFASQIAVWSVERIFDVGGFTVLIVSAFFFPSALHDFVATAPADVRHWIHVTGYSLIALVSALSLGAILIAFHGHTAARWVERLGPSFPQALCSWIAQRIREFAEGLDTIHNPMSFLLVLGSSVLMWWMIALAYSAVAHAYATPELSLSATEVLILMGGSMVGSLVQLPGVGGGSQLATISIFDHVFKVLPKELAVSCGIMIWLVTFVSVVPLGLYFAHHERISLRKVSEQSMKAEEAAVNTGS